MPYIHPKTAAVTGGTGFLGRHLLEHLGASGYSVRALVRRQKEPSTATLSWVPGDLADVKALRKLLEGAPSTVFHLAGVAHTSLESEEERARARAINIDGAGTLLQEAQRAGVRRVVLLSSAHVYGSSGINVPENAPLHPASFYAETKVAMEEIGWQAAAAGLEVIVARPSLCYGPGVVFNLHALLSAISRGRYFHIGSRNPERSFASVHTVSSGLVHLAEHGSSGCAYNLADREPVDLCSFADDLSVRMGKPKLKTLPYSLAWCGAALLTAVDFAGVRVPLTLESLAKLTVPFSLDLSRLAATGFRWPDAVDRTCQQMVDAYLRQQTGEVKYDH